MSFKFSDQHIDSFQKYGYTVFQSIIPPSLIKELRIETDKARKIARRISGPLAQRLQPIIKYQEELDLQPFKDFEELELLNHAYQKVLSPHHEISCITHEMSLDLGLGILIETESKPNWTNWHRDITKDSDGVDPTEMEALLNKPKFFAQVNCPLYTDTSTWYVPGSDGRENFKSEEEAALKNPKEDLSIADSSNEELEYLGLKYCRSMPGAIQLILEAGDFALYRPNGWHIGNYTPYRKRATLHCGVLHPETTQWHKRWVKAKAQLKKQKVLA